MNDRMAGPDKPTASGPFDGSEPLDSAEKEQAVEHSAPAAVVIHEIVRKEGQAELERSTGAIFWSGLAAGLSMGFSFLALALLQSGLPEGPSRRLLDSPGYSLGFVIVVLGRQQLFTESTLTAVLPLLVRRDRATWLALLRFWGIVLSANILGTLIFARLIAIDGLFPEPLRAALSDIGRDAVTGPFWPTLIKAVFAGWLIALMIWLLPSARSARLLVIMLLTYVVAIGRFSHVIAGSVEAFFAIFAGEATLYDYATRFFAPTIIGNTLGGVALVALLNHAPLAPEFQE
jgi:formate/nitrite transporter FocA (FNT family)